MSSYLWPLVHKKNTREYNFPFLFPFDFASASPFILHHSRSSVSVYPFVSLNNILVSIFLSFPQYTYPKP